MAAGNDACELWVVAEENLGEGLGQLLNEILAGLRQLGAGVSVDQTPLTKQGGV